MDSQNILTFLKVRPISVKPGAGVSQTSKKSIINYSSDGKTISLSSPHSTSKDDSENNKFVFDSVLSPGITQDITYKRTTEPIVNAVMSGYNGTGECTHSHSHTHSTASPLSPHTVFPS